MRPDCIHPNKLKHKRTDTQETAKFTCTRNTHNGYVNHFNSTVSRASAEFRDKKNTSVGQAKAKQSNSHSILQEHTQEQSLGNVRSELITRSDQCAGKSLIPIT